MSTTAPTHLALADDVFMDALKQFLTALALVEQSIVAGGAPGQAQTVLKSAHTRTICFNATAAAVLSWVADADYYIVECGNDSAGTRAWALSLDGTTEASAVGTTAVKLNLISLRTPLKTMRQPLNKDSILYCSHNIAGECCVVLEYR
jgi:hypothetical protein